MKKLTVLTLLFIGFLALSQTGIRFEENKFADILAKAKKENKLIFIDAYTTWCAPCKLMAKNIFTLQSVGDYYNTNFVNAKIDMEKGEGINIAKKYNVKQFPTYLFINGDGELMHKVIGSAEEKQFIEYAKDAQDPNKRVPALKKKFENGEKDPEFLKNLASLTIFSDQEFAGKVLTRYFQAKQDFTEDDLDFLLPKIKSTDDPAYKIFKTRRSDIIKVFPENEYNMLDKNIKLGTIVKKSYKKNPKVIDEKYFLSEAGKEFGKEQAIKYLQEEKSRTALKNKDFASYEKISLEMYKDFSNASSGELNNVAWNFFENVKAKSSLEKALAWAQASVKKDQNYGNTDTLANLYNKLGDKKNAEEWAIKAIELAKSKGEDSSETQKLLDSLK